MPVYSTHQAKTHLSEFIRMVERGETITITRSGIPVALLVRIGATPQPRRPGTLRTTMRMNPVLDFRDGPRQSRTAAAAVTPAAAATPAAAVTATVATSATRGRTEPGS
jgi:prevent-host-death family protein